MSRWSVALVVIGVVGCGDDTIVDAAGSDAPTIDAPRIDAPTIDAPAIDAPTVDAPTTDAPELDASPPDAAPVRPTISSINRAALCLAQSSQTLNVMGADFLAVGTSVPMVTLTDFSGSTSRVYSSTPSGCVPDPSSGGQLCTQLQITIGQNDLPVATYSVVVQNPAPSTLQSVEFVTLLLTPPPVITGVSVPGSANPRISESGGTVVVAGSRFEPGAIANLSLSGGPSVDALQNDVSADGTTLTATFGNGLTANATFYTLSIRNPDGCSQDDPNAVEVVP